MVTRIRFCARCQRPIKAAHTYCSDCEILLSSPIMSTPRCSNCTITSQIAGSLYWNKKLKKIYCLNCLQIFKKEMAKQGFNESQINNILKNDFQSLS